jgi:hypothetical protein
MEIFLGNGEDNVTETLFIPSNVLTRIQYLANVSENIKNALDAKASQLALSSIIGVPPDALNSIEKLATSLGGDANIKLYIDTADALKANIASPALTGLPTCPDNSLGNNTSRIANTRFVMTQISAITGIPPSQLNSLEKIATSLGGDANIKQYIDSEDALKANLNSPNFSGIPTVPDTTSGDNTGKIANCKFVSQAIADLVATAPSTLNTLNELATALGNDANFSTTMTNNLAGKAGLAAANTYSQIQTFNNTAVFNSGVSGLTKSDVGLANVANLAGIDLPISSATQTALDLKSNITYVDTGLGLKSDITYVDTALALKSDITYVDTGLATKVNTSTFNTALALKSDITYVDSGLGLKSDITYVDTGLATKVNTSTFNTALALKSDITYVDTGLGLKSDITYVDNGLATKTTLSAVQSNNNAFTGTNTFNTSLPTSTLTPSTNTQLITKVFADGAYAPLTNSYTTLSAVQSNTNTFTNKNIFNSQVDITTISEKLVIGGSPSAGVVTANYANSGLMYYNPVDASALTLNITNITGELNKTFVYTVLWNSATHKNKFTAVQINSVSRTLMFEGSNSVSLATATLIVQRFCVIFTSSATVPTAVITSISTFTP